MEEVAEVLVGQLLIPNADDPNAMRGDLAVPLKVANRMALLHMDAAVQLDSETQLRTVEVHDERAHDLLASKS